MSKVKSNKKMIQTGFRLPEGKKKHVEEWAKVKGQTLQEFLMEALDLRMNFPAEFWELLQTHAEKLRLPVSYVIAHMIYKQIVFDYAWFKTFGVPIPGQYDEFRFDESGLITADALTDLLEKKYRKDLKKIKAKMVKAEQTDDSENPNPFEYYLNLRETKMAAAAQAFNLSDNREP